jgi:hypothetical protein
MLLSYGDYLTDIPSVLYSMSTNSTSNGTGTNLQLGLEGHLPPRLYFRLHMEVVGPPAGLAPS